MTLSSNTSSPIKSCDYDIVIAGGGMVGISLALLLSQASNGQLKTLVVESFKAPETADKKVPVYNSSFDTRSTALSYGSRLIFDSIGLWGELSAHLTEIQRIHVSEQRKIASVLMNSSDVGWPSLGYVVENAWLGQVLLRRLKSDPSIELLSPSSITSIRPGNEVMDLLIADEGGEKNCTAQLAIVADGANSTLRKSLGIDINVHDYQQTALISNVSTQKPHLGCAYERFTSQGPMAMLPLSDSAEGDSRSALVWSMDDSDAEILKQASEDDFLARLQQQFGHRLGEFIRTGDRFSYPLKRITASEQVRSGVVIMGNAAHSLHPVAGQGFNLALRDGSRLTSLLADAHSKGMRLGELSLLQRYEQLQADDQQKTIQFSHRLPSLLGKSSGPISLAGTLGLAAMDSLPWLKSRFVHHAAGLHDGAATGV